MCTVRTFAFEMPCIRILKFTFLYTTAVVATQVVKCLKRRGHFRECFSNIHFLTQSTEVKSTRAFELGVSYLQCLGLVHRHGENKIYVPSNLTCLIRSMLQFDASILKRLQEALVSSTNCDSIAQHLHSILSSLEVSCNNA